MRSRKSFAAVLTGILTIAMVAPAQASADSFPEKVSDYVSDNTGYFVAALLAAILLLLLIVRITQRRSKEKQPKQAAAAPGAPAG
jgi:Ca2+/H+ antiporter